MESPDPLVQVFDQYMGHNVHTIHKGIKRDNITTLQGPILNDDKQIHYKINPFNGITQILAEKILNDITIKSYYYPRITDPYILKLFPVGKYEPLYFYHKYVITI